MKIHAGIRTEVFAFIQIHLQQEVTGLEQKKWQKLTLFITGILTWGYKLWVAEKEDLAREINFLQTQMCSHVSDSSSVFQSDSHPEDSTHTSLKPFSRDPDFKTDTNSDFGVKCFKCSTISC